MKHLRETIVADIMMVKVARWLRLMGIKVSDAKYIDDTDILNYVKKYKHPVLLTSDVEFSRRANKVGINAICVPAKLEFQDQVAYVIKRLDYKLDKNKISTLCTKCAHRLQILNKSELKDLKNYNIPNNSYNSYSKFYYCKYCKKVYWHGSHWNHIIESIKLIEKKAYKK